MAYELGINTGFAVNRYSEPEQWGNIVGGELGLKNVQLTADLLNVDLPAAIVKRYIDRINKIADQNGFKIRSTFTGAFTRVNHLAHPDREIRDHWIHWFKKFVDLSVDTGAESMGSHFGILTHEDNGDPEKRKERVKQNIEGWHQIADYAKGKGLKFLSWEPMSISREQGETLAAARELQDKVNENAPLPFKVCLDVDHGELTSPNPDDTNPYRWLEDFAVDSPLIHLKQSSKNKGGHWPFTKEHNENGKIDPEKVCQVLSDKGNTDAQLILELSFRERNPVDANVVSVLKESVEFWRASRWVN